MAVILAKGKKSKNSKSGGKEGNGDSSGIKFSKGSQAQEAIAQEDAKAEERKNQQGKLWRFYIPKTNVGDDFSITFLDGNLDDEGMLDIPYFFEHGAKYNGRFDNFVCIAKSSKDAEPCPLCEEGNNATLVGALTIIDHTEYMIESGPNEGNIRKNQKRLFIAKRTTLKQLQKLASKRGGLAGCTFEVSRSTDRVASVGDMFEFIEKRPLKTIQKEIGKDGEGNEIAVPANYDQEIVFRDAETLRKMGFGAGSSIGSEEVVGEDLDDEL